MLLTFGVFLILFLSFPETNLGSVEKASVKDEGRLLTAYAYEALTLLACIHVLNFTNANLPVSYLVLLATVSLIGKLYLWLFSSLFEKGYLS